MPSLFQYTLPRPPSLLPLSLPPIPSPRWASSPKQIVSTSSKVPSSSETHGTPINLSTAHTHISRSWFSRHNHTFKPHEGQDDFENHRAHPKGGCERALYWGSQRRMAYVQVSFDTSLALFVLQNSVQWAAPLCSNSYTAITQETIRLVFLSVMAHLPSYMLRDGFRRMAHRPSLAQSKSPTSTSCHPRHFASSAARRSSCRFPSTRTCCACAVPGSKATACTLRCAS